MSDRAESPERGVRKCDLLIRNAYVITMDPKRAKFPKGAVAIYGRDIVAVGPEADVAPRFRPLRIIDANGAPVHPGYIDLHYHISGHLASKLLEDGAASSEGAGAWIASRYQHFFNGLGDEEEYASALLAGLDMLRNGFTMYVEPGTIHNPDVIAEACEGLGIRAWVGDPWLWDVETSGGLRIDRAPIDTKRCLKLLGGQLWRNKDPDALVGAHVAIYGGGSQSEELMRAAKACADDHNVPFNTHQSMSEGDAGFDAERFGCPAYVHWSKIGVLDRKCVFVHSNVLQDDEIQPIIDSGMTIVWVPGNSFYYGMRKRVPNRIPELYHKGLNIGFGLDVSKTWTFGHNTLLAYNIAREEEQYLFPDDLLAIQTINGAKAMMVDDRLGSLEPGKRADLVIRSNDSPWNYPVHHIERDLTLYSLTRSVDTVIVDGRIVVKNGHHVLLDEEVIYQRAQKAAEKLLEGAG
ncbi:MAG: amidohydrolase family protein [Dehalococcoidia bacterium]